MALLILNETSKLKKEEYFQLLPKQYIIKWQIVIYLKTLLIQYL